MNNYGLYRKRNTDDKAQCYIKLMKNHLKGVNYRKLKRDKRVIWHYPKKSLNLNTVWFEHGYKSSSQMNNNEQDALVPVVIGTVFFIGFGLLKLFGR